MSQKILPKRRGKARARNIERVRVICIRNTDYCVCDGMVPLAIYSNKDDADLHRQWLIRQQAEGQACDAQHMTPLAAG
jgi:predicted  nucleic acid-binding Zn ribbon protein